MMENCSYHDNIGPMACQLRFISDGSLVLLFCVCVISVILRRLYVSQQSKHQLHICASEKLWLLSASWLFDGSTTLQQVPISSVSPAQLLSSFAQLKNVYTCCVIHLQWKISTNWEFHWMLENKVNSIWNIVRVAHSTTSDVCASGTHTENNNKIYPKYKEKFQLVTGIWLAWLAAATN